MLNVTARMTSASLSRPKVEDVGGCVMVRIRHRQSVPSHGSGRNLTESQDAILDRLDWTDDALVFCGIRNRLGLQAKARRLREDRLILTVWRLDVTNYWVTRALPAAGYPDSLKYISALTYLGIHASDF